MPYNPIPTGKLPPQTLKRLLAMHARPGRGVVVGPGIGLDAAVLDAGLPGEYLVAKTDPITFVSADIGAYAVNVNANDIACMGGTPMWFMAAVILPEGGSDEGTVEEIFGGLSAACGSLGISLVGGHTEVTHGLDRPIVVGHMLGTVKKDRLVTTAGAKPGDAIILTKGIPIEALSIIAREKREELLRHFGLEHVERCANFVADPGISVVKDAAVAVAAGEVHCMHDPTEGGLSSGLYEIADAAGVGIEVDASAIRVLPEAFDILRIMRLDPLGVIASGALVVTAPPEDAGAIVHALADAGIYAGVIGRVTEKAGGVRILRHGASEPMPVFARDEITKIF
ncbi:MAG TPA: AIR synthase family protein [Nitrospirota bacterium]